MTTITADPRSLHKLAVPEDTRDGSTDNIVREGLEMAPMGKVYQETTIEITHEPANPSEAASQRSSKDDDFERPAPVWGR